MTCTPPGKENAPVNEPIVPEMVSVRLSGWVLYFSVYPMLSFVVVPLPLLESWYCPSGLPVRFKTSVDGELKKQLGSAELSVPRTVKFQACSSTATMFANAGPEQEIN